MDSKTISNSLKVAGWKAKRLLRDQGNLPSSPDTPWTCDSCGASGVGQDSAGRHFLDTRHPFQRALPPADPIEALAAAIEATFPTLPDSVRIAWMNARNVLADQPLKFTHEDVRMLRAFAEHFERQDDSPRAAADAHNLADRIAALLPPSSSGGENPPGVLPETEGYKVLIEVKNRVRTLEVDDTPDRDGDRGITSLC